MSDIVSVIIPAFNAAKTLPRMLRCILAQTYEALEIILVNDGSKDRTAAIMHDAAEADPRIIVIDKHHAGVGNARNAGLERATGKYICFFDADDAVPPRAVARMVRVAKKTHADLVIGKVKYMDYEDKSVTASTERLGDSARIGKFNHNIIANLSIWNKLFKSDIIRENSIRFNSTRRGEDSVFFFYYWQYCTKISGCPYVVYHYERRKIRGKKSLSQKTTLSALEQMHHNYKEMIAVIDSAIEKEINYLETETEITEEELKEKTKRLDSFRSLLCRKAILTLVNKYYRAIPEPSPTRIKTVERMVRVYRKKITEADWETVVIKAEGIMDEEGRLAQTEHIV